MASLPLPRPDMRAHRNAPDARHIILRDSPAPSLTDLFGAHWLPDTLSTQTPRPLSRTGARHGR